MVVRVDGFRQFRINDKDKTVVQCTMADMQNDIKSFVGFMHLPDVWLDGLYTYTPGELYEAETQPIMFNGKLELKILSIKPIKA